MAWLVAYYQPVALFSLKHSEATSTGGKSLLVPTPFAIRMALLDAAIRTEGFAAGKKAFECIKSLRLALKPPAYAVVSGLFCKVLKPERKKDINREMTPSIAFREYVHLWDRIGLAFQGDGDSLQIIVSWLQQITYFGKRGSFFQLLKSPEMIPSNDGMPPQGFVPLVGLDQRDGELPSSFPLGLIQRLDDWGPGITMEKANIYDASSQGKISLGKDRQRIDVILPYRMIRAGRGFTIFQRFNND